VDTEGANKWLKRTPPSVTPPARTEAQAPRHLAPPLSHTVMPHEVVL